MDWIIRETTPENAEALLAFFRQVGAESDNLSFGAEGIPIPVDQERKYLQSVQEDAHAVSYCLWQDGELIGNGSLSRMPRRMAHRAELSICVAKAYWGQGVGTALMEQLLSFAKAAGIEILSLEVRSDNLRAIRLYQRFGFQKIGTFPAFFKIGDRYADFDLMCLDLRPAK